MMNSLGDFPFPSMGGAPYQAYAPQFLGHVAPNPYPFPMPPSPSLTTKPKSTIGYYNGSRIAAGAGAGGTQPQPPPMPLKMAPCNGFGYSGYPSTTQNASFGHLQDNRPQQKTLISENGHVQNLPQSMLNDQYGIAALLLGRKTEKLLKTGVDTLSTEVKTEMNAQVNNSSNEPLYKRFSGPLELQIEPESFSQEVKQEKPIHPEYLVTQRLFADSQPDIDYIRKTYALKPEQFGEDLLFFVFYTFTQDILQVVAAGHLYQKGWRYHMDAKVWMQRMVNEEFVKDSENPAKEKGTYIYFDNTTWTLVQAEMTLDTSKLEGPPSVPPEYFVSACPKV